MLEQGWCFFFGYKEGGCYSEEEYKHQLIREKRIKQIMKRNIDLEMNSRLKEQNYDVKSYGDCLNNIAAPFCGSFECYRGISHEIIEMIGDAFFKFVHLVLMIKLGHVELYDEVIKYGFIKDVEKQKLWKMHYDMYINEQKKIVEFSCIWVYNAD